jgi:hypothetical protein
VRSEKDVPQGLISKITMDLAAGFGLSTFVAVLSLLASRWLLDIVAGYVVSLEMAVFEFRPLRSAYLFRLRTYCRICCFDCEIFLGFA